MKNNKQSKTITTTYNIPTQLSGSVHIALISDVHDRCPDAALSILASAATGSDPGCR